MIRNLCKMAMICTMLSYISCTKDYVEKPVETTRSIPVSLFLASQDDTANETRAGVQVAEDAQVKTMDLLIFDENNRFMKRVQVLDALLQQTQTGVNFTADLDITNKKRTIHFIANGRTASGEDRLNFNEITANMDMAAAIKALKTTALPSETAESGISMKQHVMPLVMWSQQVLSSGVTPNTSIRDLKLLRSAAAVQVKVSNSVTGFTISRVTLHKSVTTGFIAPTNSTSVVIPGTGNPVPTTSYMHHDRGWVSGTAPTLYTYERKCSNSDYMGVLIEATYNNVRGYYKVSFKSGTGWYHVVRNHRYIVTITAANAPGYATVEEAISAPLSNERLTVTINDEASEFPFIAADGQYYMGLTNNQVTAYQQNEKFTEICRVYTSRNIQPTMTLTSNQDLVYEIVVQKERDKVYVIKASIRSRTAEVESAMATIKCGNLSLPLKITNNKKRLGSDSDSYVLDLLESTDRNWMVDIKTQTASMKLSGTLSSAGDYPAKAAEMTNSLSDKYWRKAYLHVKTAMSASEGTLFMTGSNASSEPFVRKIIVHN